MCLYLKGKHECNELKYRIKKKQMEHLEVKKDTYEMKYVLMGLSTEEKREQHPDSVGPEQVSTKKRRSLQSG